MYQVGDLTEIRANDPLFSDETAALIYALAQQARTGQPVGVWSAPDEGSELLAIVYEGAIYRS